jgi:hypothetical protein
MPSYALISTNLFSLPPPSAHKGGGGTESTEGVGRQEPPSASNAVGGATEQRFIVVFGLKRPSMSVQVFFAIKRPKSYVRLYFQ